MKITFEKMYLGVSCDIFLIFNWIYVVMATPRFTTPHIRDVFIGRCWQYQTTQKKVNINCTELWEAFIDEFSHKDPCSSNSSITYSKFFTLLQADANTTLQNAMFYSGSKELVDHFAHINDDYVVLEETLTGFVLDKLTWCGSATSPDGLNYTHCPKWNDKCDVTYTAWKYASRKFARRANGTAHTLLNASRHKGTAYHKTGFFRQYEMPELKVDRLVVLVASNIVNPSSEKCGTGSLLELQDDAEKRNITVECIDQPELVLRIFCIKYPKSSHCIQKINRVKPRLFWKTVSIIFIIITATIVVMIALYNGQKYYKYKYNLYLRRISYSSKRSVINHEELAYNNNEEPF